MISTDVFGVVGVCLIQFIGVAARCTRFSLIAVADAQDGLEQGQPPGQLARDAGLVFSRE
jgi:hypothetical protein